MSDESTEFALTADGVERWLREIGCTYTRREHIFDASIDLGGTKHDAFIVSLSGGVVFHFKPNDLPQLTPQTAASVDRTLMLLNDQIPFGCFTTTRLKSGLVFKVGTFFEGETPSDAVLTECVGVASYNIAFYVESIRRVIAGELAPNMAVSFARDAEKNRSA
jgi:hypothetical protein